MHTRRKALPAMLAVTFVTIMVGFITGNILATGSEARAAGTAE